MLSFTAWFKTRQKFRVDNFRLEKQILDQINRDYPRDDEAQKRLELVDKIAYDLRGTEMDKTIPIVGLAWYYLSINAEMLKRQPYDSIELGQDRAIAAKKYWSENQATWGKLESLLAKGPLQQPPFRTIGQDVLHVLPRGLATTGLLLLHKGDRKEGIRALKLGILLGDRILTSELGYDDYFHSAELSLATSKIVSRAVREASLTMSESREILLALPPTPQTDKLLFRAIWRSFFQEFMIGAPTLPSLAGTDPTRNPNWAPVPELSTDPLNYNSQETADEAFKQYQAAAQNANRYLSDRQQAPVWVTESDMRTLLQAIQNHQKNPDKNGVGKLFVAIGLSSMSGSSAQIASGRWRAMRECTRVLLASRIYRSSHERQLPQDTKGFENLLGKWPTDPFNGKPLRYDPTKETVYSVGPNLKDDGGDIAMHYTLGGDYGVSLKLSNP